MMHRKTVCTSFRIVRNDDRGGLKAWEKEETTGTIIVFTLSPFSGCWKKNERVKLMKL